MTPLSPTPAVDIALIGLGAAGALVFINLVQHSAHPRRVALIDTAAEPALGVAYSTPHPEHLLNVRADCMGALAGQPRHFFDWLHTPAGLAARTALNLSIPLTENAFLPRRLYGAYLRYLYSDARETALKKGWQLVEHRDNVTNLTPTENGHTLTLESGAMLTAVDTVLALGNALSRPDSAALPHVYTKPWQADIARLSAEPPSAHPVVLIGAGLTAMDMLLSLKRRRWPHGIVLVSRHGALPQGHLPDARMVSAPLLAFEDVVGKRLSAVLQQLRRVVRAGHPWQHALDSIRPYTARLWQSLPATDQQRLLGKYYNLWGTHRHRLGAPPADSINELLSSGQITRRKAAYKKTEIDAAGQLNVYLSDNDAPLRASAVFDCRGLGLSPRAHPLLARLTESGTLHAHESGVGIKPLHDFLLHQNGASRVFGIGSMLVGAYFESIAMPELRTQAQQIAQALLGVGAAEYLDTTLDYTI